MSTRPRQVAPERAPSLTRELRGAMAGMVGASLFVGVFTVEGWLRPGYSARSMFVSELSLGPRGGIQIVSFMVTGALVVVFGRGLAAHATSGPAHRAGPVLVQVVGVSLLASGPFLTDPSAMFDQVSVHGLIHGVLGALVFSLAPVSCFVWSRRFRVDHRWRGLTAWTVAAGVVLTLGVVVLKVAQQPATALFAWKGLVQRVLLVTYLAWVFTVALRLRAVASPVRPPRTPRGARR